MKTSQATFIFEISESATAGEIRTLISNAEAQLEDPRDEDGERVGFEVAGVRVDWFAV